MSDSPAATEDALFSAKEIEQFDADDVVAGSAIGKMLSILFLYTVIAMSLVGGWTYMSIQADNSGDAADTESHENH